MPVGLYMDVHVPKAVTSQLRRRGIDVLTAREDDAELLEDSDILERATKMGRVVITQDIRFGALAESCQASGHRFASLVFAHQVDVTIGQMVKDLELIALASLPSECENQVFRLPL